MSGTRNMNRRAKRGPAHAKGQLTLDFEQKHESEYPHVEAPPPNPRSLLVLAAEQLANWALAPQVLNIVEASFLTRIPVKTLYKWNAAGKLKGITSKIGKELRFDRDALLRLWKHDSRKAAH